MKIEKWNGKKIHIRPDRYVNATDIDKATKKRYRDFLKADTTQEYLQALSQKCNLPVYEGANPPQCDQKQQDTIQHSLIEVAYKGKTRNTYFHPKLALRFAQWCSAEFAVEVDFWLDDMLTGSVKKTLPVGIDESRHQLYRPIEQGKLAWLKTFPDYFYEALFRLDNREIDLKAKPPCMAKYTIKYIYDQMMRTAPKAIYKELVLLRSEHEKQGLKGLGLLHQYLSPEGRELLEKTIRDVTFLINMAIEYSPIIEQRKQELEKWLNQRSGQYSLGIADSPAIHAVINKMRETA